MKFVRITAIWCTSCLLMKKRWKNTIERTSIEIEDLDFDFDEPSYAKYQIGSILPVVILLDDSGKEIKRMIGEKSIKDLETWLEGVR